MLEIAYAKTLPYPFDVIRSQYFDYEHIAHVHPTTLGEYRLVEASAERIVYDQVWPNGRVSRVEQRYDPPADTEFVFVSGPHRGIRVRTHLTDLGDSTRVDETYVLPLPNWGWLKPLLKPLMLPAIEKVWKEDTDVGVCYGGWPGVPDAPVSAPESPAAPSGRRVLGKAADFPGPACVDGVDLLVLRGADGGFCAREGRCPHTGGPLALGKVEGGAVVCPWHGARFDGETGEVLSGPARRGLRTFPVAVEGDDLVLLPEEG